MYHRLRGLHRWVGLVNALFLLLIAATGFLLATKKTTDWIRPLERKGSEMASLADAVPIAAAAEAAFAQGLPLLQKREHIDRIDYRPKDNIYKVVSRRGYHEVQVDGATGKALNVAQRRDQFIEDLHTLTWFSTLAYKWVLPIVGVSLFLMSLTGIYIFFVPILRRRAYHKKKASGGVAS